MFIYISVVVAIASVVISGGGIIEAPFFNNYTTLRTDCKRT
jgi:hypothetical protein